MSDGPTEAAREEAMLPSLAAGRMGCEQPEFRLKDRGQGREQMPTGSQRDSRKGRGRFDLLWDAHHAIDDLAKLFEAGAAKYEPRNWLKGQTLSRYLDSATSHLRKWVAGETDENHLVQACWNLLAAIETRARVRKGQLPAELEDVGQ